jgi:hypothetical protein
LPVSQSVPRLYIDRHRHIEVNDPRYPTSLAASLASGAALSALRNPWHPSSAPGLTALLAALLTYGSSSRLRLPSGLSLRSRLRLRSGLRLWSRLCLSSGLALTCGSRRSHWRDGCRSGLSDRSRRSHRGNGRLGDSLRGHLRDRNVLPREPNQNTQEPL